MTSRPKKSLWQRGLLLGALLVGISQSGCRAEPWVLWNQYADHFVDGQGRVLDFQAGERSTSEGEAYSMLFALAANDRDRFDKVLQWTENNLAGGDLTTHLPAWSWGRGSDNQWHTLDANSAADADLWMSYTLLQAGRLWREPRYTSLGLLMASRIASQEVVELPQYGPVLMPGSVGFRPDSNTWILNLSYTPLPVITALAKAAPTGPWKRMASNLPRLLKASAPSGFAMDWTSYNQQAGIRPSAPPSPDGTAGNSGLTDAVGSYDAIRVYLWAGMTDPATPGARDMLNAVPGMANYLASQPTPPERVGANGQVLSANGPVGFSAALMPYVAAYGKMQALELQRSRLDAQKDPSTGLYGRDAEYYDQNLVLFALGWTERRIRFDRDGTLKVKWD